MPSKVFWIVYVVAVVVIGLDMFVWRVYGG
jgi:hypothetical protein